MPHSNSKTRYLCVFILLLAGSAACDSLLPDTPRANCKPPVKVQNVGASVPDCPQE